MTALVWRKEPPDAPGWWWMRGLDGKPLVVEVRERISFGYVALTGFIYGSWSNLGTWWGVEDTRIIWAGPIAEPEEAPDARA